MRTLAFIGEEPGPFEEEKAVRLENKLQEGVRTARMQKARHGSQESAGQSDAKARATSKMEQSRNRGSWPLSRNLT